MGYRKVPFIEGEFYHIYSRGNNKQKIFFDDYDRDRFVKLLYLCNSKININFRNDIVRPHIDAWNFDRGELVVNIGAWTLMPNHFHIYLTINNLSKKLPKSDLGRDKKNQITEFMRKLLTSYSKYINAKYQRTGGLFEGKFKATHIETDQQAKYNFSYIHLNPIKLIDSKWRENGIKNIKESVKFLENYKWSSYLDYKDIFRPENKILNRKHFLDYFQNIKDFNSEILEWLKFSEN